jgi:hypothetical protein
MITKIAHCKKEKYDVYIGRPAYFGNPFEIGKDGNRKEVIEKYKDWFIMQIKTNHTFRIQLDKLKGKTLGCWCKPLACHGDIIANYLNKNDN